MSEAEARVRSDLEGQIEELEQELEDAEKEIDELKQQLAETAGTVPSTGGMSERKHERLLAAREQELAAEHDAAISALRAELEAAQHELVRA